MSVKYTPDQVRAAVESVREFLLTGYIHIYDEGVTIRREGTGIRASIIGWVCLQLGMSVKRASTFIDAGGAFDLDMMDFMDNGESSQATPVDAAVALTFWLEGHRGDCWPQQYRPRLYG